MASPPAKRQRRTRTVFSDDEDEETEAQQQLLSARTNASLSKPGLKKPPASQKSNKATASKPRSRPPTTSSKTPPRKAATSAKSTPSPSKANKTVSQKPKEEGSKSLHSFFGRASEEQRWNRKADTPSEEVADGEQGDAIEDDDSLDEAFLEIAEGKGDTKLVLDRRKVGPLNVNGPPSKRSNAPAAGAKFVKPSIPGGRKTAGKLSLEETSSKELHRPWADRYGPTNLEELQVHKKKVADVQRWLSDVLNGRDPRKILVLKGPAGSGKTMTVSLLARASNFQNLCWSNPTVSDPGNLSSIASQFDEFVNRSGQFGSLDFGDSAFSNQDSGSGIDINALRRVLVVEEFPSSVTRSSNALESFRNVLLRYLAANSTGQHAIFGIGKSSIETTPPIVMIITESLLTSATASADSFTAHRLLGPEISNHPLVTIMEFNAVAPSFVARALDLVIKKEARDSQRRRVPGPAVLKKLSEMGDIRSAVNALEFLCSRSGDNEDWSGRVAAKMKKSDKDGIALTVMEKSSLEMVTQREATLGMFHAVGKVVYNKREDPQIADARAEPPPKPPDHLSHLHRTKTSQVSIDELINETGTDIPTFISTLHENYLLSCDGPTFLESFDNCIDSLSDSDILGPEGRSLSKVGYGAIGSGKGLSHAGGLDMLRQNEISFHVAVRGLLFALPYPVHRAAHPGGRKGDSFKMFYPASLRLWKPMEEADSLITLLMDQITFAGVQGARYQGRSGEAEAGVASWKQKNNAINITKDDEIEPEIPRSVSSRADMLFDRLPYLSKIQDTTDPHLRKVEQVTQFNGVHLQDESETLSEEGGAADNAIDLSAADETTDRLVASPKKKKDRIMRVVNDTGSAQLAAAATTMVTDNSDGDVQMEKLYISDDDIQDD